ncbi:hypothetical protein [Nannocystis sp.]|uniref:hypothetical protein n=1 Tax=Nannocystis sp. TaxID=1962667 RepID=UPI0025DFDD44|nr:hypothetical protein [Nannocystis sp.]MBK7825239.1 hypothetical protein [Nannocystis sp.]
MLARHRDPRVAPLELWDLVVDGAPLYRVDRGAGFGAALGRAVESLIDGVAVSESGARFPAECHDIREVVLVGGAAGEVVWTSDRVPARHAADPEHCAEQGGRALLAELGARGLVVDLGQSRLKVSGARRRVYPRDLAEIPVSARPVDGNGRAALVGFVAAALRAAADDERPAAIVLALPCEISQDGELGTCSYPWRAGDTIVPEILAAAGLARVPTLLLNDAELAAIGVATRPPIAAPALVLTVGFGIGGALLRSSA